MSRSYDLLIDAALGSLQAHIPTVGEDEFARGQLFSVMFALNHLKLAGDWKPEPLLQQVRIQDAAFAELSRKADHPGRPAIPLTPRHPETSVAAEALEALRDEGDRCIGQLLMWLADDHGQEPIENADTLRRLLRSAVADQLKIELSLVPKSMLSSIASGEKGSDD